MNASLDSTTDGLKTLVPMVTRPDGLHRDGSSCMQTASVLSEKKMELLLTVPKINVRRGGQRMSILSGFCDAIHSFTSIRPKIPLNR